MLLQRIYFNPRSREGSDSVDADVDADYKISIHAPARGATDGKLANAFLADISIHAPARGATQEKRSDLSDT